MIRDKLILYVNNQIEQYGYPFFPNNFPFIDITDSELVKLMDYLAEKQVTRFDIGSKIEWGITKVPDNIEKITSLKSLSIRSRTITYLPETIGNLINLETLSFSRSKIEKIPSSIQKLMKLKKLQLAFLKINELPDIRNLKKLETLIINDTKIKNIPDYLCELKLLNLIDVRNVDVNYFPLCLIDKGIKIKTNDVVNLGVSNQDGNSYKVFVQIKDELKIAVKQYLSYFNQFVKRSKNEVVNFNIDENKDGLVLNFKVQNLNDLENIKTNLSEYIKFSEKPESEIIPYIHTGTSEYDKTMLMLELKQQVRHYHSMMESAKDNLKVVSSLLKIPYNDLDFAPASLIIEGFQKITESTPISSVHVEQHQMQTQSQHQMQKLKNYLEPFAKDFNELLDLIHEPKLKEDGQKLLNEVYPIMTKPTEEKIEQSGILPKFSSFIEKAKKTVDLIENGKDTYNRIAENYNGIAKILNYSLLALL